MFAAPGGDKRFRLVPVVSGVCRTRAGGDVESGTVEFDIYDGTVDKYNAIDRQRWHYENGEWSQVSLYESPDREHDLCAMLSPANCGQAFLTLLLGELLDRPDVKLNPGDYDVI